MSLRNSIENRKYTFQTFFAHLPTESSAELYLKLWHPSFFRYSTHGSN